MVILIYISANIPVRHERGGRHPGKHAVPPPQNLGNPNIQRVKEGDPAVTEFLFDENTKGKMKGKTKFEDVAVGEIVHLSVVCEGHEWTKTGDQWRKPGGRPEKLTKDVKGFKQADGSVEVFHVGQ